MKPIPFAWFLGNEGIHIDLDGDRIAYRPRDIATEIRDFIVTNRDAILRELRGASVGRADACSVATKRPGRVPHHPGDEDALTKALRGAA